jgi:hypothetical protein
MAGVATDWRIDLIKAQHGLFQLQRGAAQSCPQRCDGWQDLQQHAFVMRDVGIVEGGMCRELQIEEKCGSLLLYWRGRGLSAEDDAIVAEVIDLEEAHSCTCNVCGDEVRSNRSNGLPMTRRAAYAKGQLVDVKHRLNNMYIVQRGARGSTRTISLGRYDRAADCFGDIIPESQWIQE